MVFNSGYDLCGIRSWQFKAGRGQPSYPREIEDRGRIAEEGDLRNFHGGSERSFSPPPPPTDELWRLFAYEHEGSILIEHDRGSSVCAHASHSEPIFTDATAVSPCREMHFSHPFPARGITRSKTGLIGGVAVNYSHRSCLRATRDNLASANAT